MSKSRVRQKTGPSPAAKAAIVGFALGPMVLPPARAYYSLAIVAAATASAGLGLTALGVVGVVMLVRSNDKDCDCPPAAPPAPGELTRQMVESAQLSMGGDLGMQIRLLIESPIAYDQLAWELTHDGGPAVDAMVQATSLPADILAARWAEASDIIGPVNDQMAARSVVMGFLVKIAPDVTVAPDQAAAFAWDLAREASSPDFPDGARTHAWLAEWLGVSPDDLAASTRTSVRLSGGSDVDLRARIYADPDRFLDDLSFSLEQGHHAEIAARKAAIIDQYSSLLQEAAQSTEAVAQLR